MANLLRLIRKIIIPVILVPAAIVLIASALAYIYFYLSTGGFAPGLAFRLLGLNPASVYLLLSMCFGFAVLAMVICGSVIYIAIEVHRIGKMMETHD